MSRLITKPTKWLCTQRRLRSAWASAKTLIRLGKCPGWSESSLGAQVILLVLSWGGSYTRINRKMTKQQSGRSFGPNVIWNHFTIQQFYGHIRPKIKYFLFPLGLIRPTLKNGPTRNFFFQDLELKNIFFIHQNLYLLIRDLFFITLLFFHTILLQNSKLNTVLDIYVVIYNIFIIFWNSLPFFQDEKKNFFFTDQALSF